MKAIIEGIQSIADMLVNVFEFILTIILNTKTALMGLVKAATESMELINGLPVAIQSFATITIVISIIYLILGWSAGKSE